MDIDSPSSEPPNHDVVTDRFIDPTPVPFEEAFPEAMIRSFREGVEYLHTLFRFEEQYPNIRARCRVLCCEWLCKDTDAASGRLDEYANVPTKLLSPGAQWYMVGVLRLMPDGTFEAVAWGCVSGDELDKRCRKSTIISRSMCKARLPRFELVPGEGSPLFSAYVHDPPITRLHIGAQAETLLLQRLDWLEEADKLDGSLLPPACLFSEADVLRDAVSYTLMLVVGARLDFFARMHLQHRLTFKRNAKDQKVTLNDPKDIADAYLAHFGDLGWDEEWHGKTVTEDGKVVRRRNNEEGELSRVGQLLPRMERNLFRRRVFECHYTQIMTLFNCVLTRSAGHNELVREHTPTLGDSRLYASALLLDHPELSKEVKVYCPHVPEGEWYAVPMEMVLPLLKQNSFQQRTCGKPILFRGFALVTRREIPFVVADNFHIEDDMDFNEQFRRVQRILFFGDPHPYCLARRISSRVYQRLRRIYLVEQQQRMCYTGGVVNGNTTKV